MSSALLDEVTSAPLTIDQIVGQLKAALDKYALGLAGTCSIALDPFNVFDLLRANSRGYLLILHWAGDENIAEIPICAMTLLQHRLEVIISFNLGLTGKPDVALLQPVGNRPPLFSQVDNLRNLLLGLAFPVGVTGVNLEYQRTEPVVAPEGLPLAAYKLVCALRAVPAQPSTPTNTI